MNTKTLNLNIDICDNGAMITYPDDGTRFVVEGDKEIYQAIAGEIHSLVNLMQPSDKYNLKITITPL